MYYLDLNVKTSERFDLSKFIPLEENVLNISKSYFIEQLKTLPRVGMYETNYFDIARPDLISYKIYQKSEYWWILMVYNDLIDFTKITEKMRIEYPSLQAIENLYYTLRKYTNT